MSTGKLEHIWLKRAHGGPMDPAPRGELVLGKGLAGNTDQGGRRQVTLLDAERWARAQEELGTAVDPSLRRANLMVSGITLENTRGQVLVIGGTRLQINGETRPCNLMDEQHPGLRRALETDWGGGAYAEVLEGGAIHVGDPVHWEPAES